MNEILQNDELSLFYEDMDEQLNIMENTLMDMIDTPLEDIHEDMINDLFRVMHTLKGNASMFGFKKLISFAHVAENLLDEIRNKNINFNTEMLNVFLLVKDHAKLLIVNTNSKKQLNKEENENEKSLINSLTSFLNLKKEQELVSNEELLKPLVKYKIQIVLKNSFFKADMDILAIIKYLEVLGTISKLKIQKNNIPSLETLIVLNSYLSIDLEYETNEIQEQIEAAFEFVKDDITLKLKILEKEAPLAKKITTKIKIKKNINTSLRVDSTKVDEIINLIGEMVIANSKVSELAQVDEKLELEEASDVLSSMLEEIRQSVMNIRMIPVANSFSKFRRIVNEISKDLKKDIKFVISGEDTELDKTVIEKISDPIVHMLRNSIDHGIESIDKRLELGKKKQGRIDLRAYPDASSIVIEIQDDGAGINKEVLLSKAKQQALIKHNDTLNQTEIFNLIFEVGLSSSNEISDISGRGVGMDVVKKNIEELKGSIEIESKEGVGSKFIIRLPLTLAIIDGFLVNVAETKIIIPLNIIQECIELTSNHRKKMTNNNFINLRGAILPLLNLSEYFEGNDIKKQRENIIIIKVDKYKVGLIVNELHGEFQTVIKSLGSVFKNIKWISGGTILGNGEVALILDVLVLLKNIKQNLNHHTTISLFIKDTLNKK